MIAIKKVLVATDFSETADAALEYGRTLAHHFRAGLVLLHVAAEFTPATVGVEGYLGDLSKWQNEIEDCARKQLSERLAGGTDVSAVLVTSNAPAEAIVEYAGNNDVDLIVMGTQGRTGASRFIMGSVAERVVRTASCPVLTIHHPGRDFVPTEAARVEAAA